MASKLPPLQDDEEYNSASDDDFNPNAPQPEDAGDESSSDSGDGDADLESTKRKKPADDLDFDNSGDEATISKAKRKKRKLHSTSNERDDESGGEGGLIKTRAQRLAEKQERKPLVQAGKASINVDALWAQMSGSGKPLNGDAVNQQSNTRPEDGRTSTSEKHSDDANAISDQSPKASRVAVNQQTSEPEATVTIKRSYEFAGQILEEERVVPASSAEAKLYLEEQSRKSASAKANPSGPVRRPKKRASMFDNPGGDSEKPGTPGKTTKLNTLEKSKLDWAAHVDHEGISDELDDARRAKGGYLGRMDFLGRMDAKKEEELRNARFK